MVKFSAGWSGTPRRLCAGVACPCASSSSSSPWRPPLATRASAAVSGLPAVSPTHRRCPPGDWGASRPVARRTI